MLTDQHKFMVAIANPQQRQDYRMHMCGLCNALGNNYGALFRLFTNHDMTLLSLWMDAQKEQEPEKNVVICPLPPFAKKEIIIGSGLELCSAIDLLLLQAQLVDNILDNKGNRKLWRSIYWFVEKNINKANQLVIKSGLPLHLFFELIDSQGKIESGKTDPSIPTSELCSKIFSMTGANLEPDACNESLKIIGLAYGRYIYLMDAFRDFPDDIINNQFNPLKNYSSYDKTYIKLSLEGMKWLQSNFISIRSTIIDNLPKIKFYRYAETIKDLMISPLDKIIQSLSVDIDIQHEMVFRRWQISDAIKASLFFMPIISIPFLASQGHHHSNMITNFANSIQCEQVGMRITASEISGFHWLTQYVMGNFGHKPGLIETGPCGQVCNGASDTCGNGCQSCGNSDPGQYLCSGFCCTSDSFATRPNLAKDMCNLW